MNRLERKVRKNDKANKYRIDCDELEKNPSIIPIILERVMNTNDDITILKSIIEDKNIISKQKHIVIKIGKVNKIIENEFMIGKFLEKNNIPGFIKYTCLFKCFDDIYHKIDMNNIKLLSPCNAKKENENIKNVLIMPFIEEGSIRSFKWNTDKYEALKSIIQQTIMSFFMAYQLYGLLYNDIHLDNFLIKKTKKETINYKFKSENENETEKNSNIDIDVEIKTYGYKIVITDFENSMFVIKNKDVLRYYWNNLGNIISILNFSLKNKDDDKVIILDLSNIISFLIFQENLNNPSINTLKLLDMIKNTKITTIEQMLGKNIYEANDF